MTRTIREYTSEYRKQMEDICLATASEKARTDILHGIFTLKMYCDLYLDHGEVLMLVDEKNQAAGYVMAAPDIRSFRSSLLKRCTFLPCGSQSSIP